MIAGVRVPAAVDAVRRLGKAYAGYGAGGRAGRGQHRARADTGEVAQAQRDGGRGRRRPQRVVREDGQDQPVEGRVDTGRDLAGAIGTGSAGRPQTIA